MRRTFLSVGQSVVIVASLALGAARVASADDSSMSMYTGDSYAYFNNLDYSLGKFNVARTPRAEQPGAIVKSPARDAVTERPILLATRPSGTSRTSPFRDDTGA
jgi:hypothetical protein